MALVKFGGGIVGMAGKIAGTVFGRNRYGQYARGWAKPVNPRTARQNEIRALTSQLGELWQNTLTEEQRQAWNLYASNVTMKNRLGESILLSGFNQFCRTNAAAIYAGLNPFLNAPGEFALAEQDPTLALSIDIGEQEIDVTFDDSLAWPAENGAALLIHVGAPQRSNKQFFNGPWRYADAILGSSTSQPTSPATVATPFPIGSGQKVWVRARILRGDGRLSEFFRDEVLSVPAIP